MIITAQAHARAGMVGNPSDGYFGKTISFIIRNFRARVNLWESPYFEIIPGSGDHAKFASVGEFLRDQKLHGYYGGKRLIKGAIKRFHDYCRQQNIDVPDRSFTINYDSDIPRLVGLSGSSAIVIATLRALMKFYEIQIPKHFLPTLALAVEKEELGISAGLQDRVIQTYEGIVHMDFEKAFVEPRGYGHYEPLSPARQPPLFVAFDPDRAEVSDVPHRNLRSLYERGDKNVVETMATFRTLVDRAKPALLAGDWKTLGECINENFELRKKIMQIAPENQRMVDVARKLGASAHFCGSGGSICGLYQDGRMYQNLVDALGEIRCAVTRPIINET